MLRGPLPTLQQAFDNGPIVDYGNHRLAVRAIKVVADGALGSRAPPCSSPIPTSRDDRTPRHAARGGLCPDARRVQGRIPDRDSRDRDRANRLVMDVFERVQREVPGARALRMRNEHAQILDRAEIPRFARLNVIASMQPTHATSDMPWAPTRIGLERTEEVPMSGGS